jgi:hypothetical protein
MRPIPIGSELVEEWNADPNKPADIVYRAVTMMPPDPSGRLEDGTPCDPVEVLVETLPATPEEIAELVAGKVELPDDPRAPRRFLIRVGVSAADLEAIQRTGTVWVSLWGRGMQPFAVWAETPPERDNDPTLLEVCANQLVRIAELEKLVRSPRIMGAD